MLEKILQEIEALCLGKYYVEAEKVKEIIRSHMEDDEWIPVEEGHPQKAGYYWAYFATPFSGYSRKVFWNKHEECFMWTSNGRKVKDKPLAWKPYYTPAPYRQKEEN